VYCSAETKLDPFHKLGLLWEAEETDWLRSARLQRQMHLPFHVKSTRQESSACSQNFRRGMCAIQPLGEIDWRTVGHLHQFHLAQGDERYHPVQLLLSERSQEV
jgi:hypothetical protein